MKWRLAWGSEVMAVVELQQEQRDEEERRLQVEAESKNRSSSSSSSSRVKSHALPSRGDDERIKGDFSHWHSGERLSADGIKACYHGIFESALNSGAFFSVHVVECVVRADMDLKKLIAAVVRTARAMNLEFVLAQRSHVVLHAQQLHSAPSQWSQDTEWDIVDVQVTKSMRLIELIELIDLHLLGLLHH